MSFGFLIINVWKDGEHYESPCIGQIQTNAAFGGENFPD
jgi:hypothetical protein